MALHINSKEFKELLKSFTRLSRVSSNTIAPITFTFEPFSASMMTEHAFIVSKPTVSILPPISEYTFNPEILIDLALTDGDVELHWLDGNSALNIKNNFLRTALRVATPTPEFIDIPENMTAIEIPIGLLHAVEKFISVPYIFLGTKKELIPIWFRKNAKGNLEISADDSCSLARINTNIPVKLKTLDIKIPRYVIETLYSKGDLNDVTPVRMGIQGMKALLANKNTQIYLAGMEEEMVSFDSVLKDYKPMVSCDFVPRKVSDAIKPLVSILPKKDKGSILVVSVDSKKMSMDILHQDIGEGIIEFVEGISNIYLENSAKLATINMVPQIFQEHTELLNVPQANMSANNRLVYYKGGCNIGDFVIDVEYIFPTAC